LIYIEQYENRLKAEKKNKKSGNVVKREICNMVTKGTFKDPNSFGFEPRYVLSFKRLDT
jgi:DNA mismatch repair ATPase MutS